MKIIADKSLPFVERTFSSIGEVSLIDGRHIGPAAIHGADLLVVRTVTPVNAALLQNSSVHFVASASSGIDHVDMDYLRDRGIGFAHAPGCNARSVAEYVLSALFVLADQYTFDLTKKCVGIIGCGHVGSQVLRFLKALGVECIVNDPPLGEAGGDVQCCNLDEVLAADVITLHVSLVEDGPYPTHHMVNQAFLRQIRKDAILINTSRGNVIDEDALMAYLERSRKACTVLDVWAREPRINMDLLSRVTIGTPHVAGYSVEGKRRAVQMVFRQVCDYFNLGCDETMLTALFEPGISEIVVSGFDSELDAVRLAVLACYDVRSDSAALRRMLAVKPDQHTEFFDELRDTYPLRREFNAMSIKLPSGRDSPEAVLRELGFTVASIQ
ncbi:MAG: 4-phosphoerythronate dehydrogenase [Gammaproteobacteria bacterium]